MSPVRHLSVASILAVGTYSVNSDLSHAAAVGVGGLVLDIDHIYEFCREWGLREGIRRLIDQTLGGPINVPNHVQFWFHGWDILLVLAALSISTFGNNHVWLFLFGAAIHLLMDQTGNPGAHIGTYFLSYRIFKGFKTKLLFR